MRQCREYLGKDRGYCPREAERGSDWCLDHIADRQVWEAQMRRGGK